VFGPLMPEGAAPTSLCDASTSPIIMFSTVANSSRVPTESRSGS